MHPAYLHRKQVAFKLCSHEMLQPRKWHGLFYAQDNLLHGSFLAELTKEVLSDLEASKYQHAEYRISIYGRKRVEWDILAAWIVQNQLYSDNVVWLIQVGAPHLRPQLPKM